MKAETAHAVRKRIRAVVEWVVAMELRADNPCHRVLHVLGPQSDIVQHWRALPHEDRLGLILGAIDYQMHADHPLGEHPYFDYDALQIEEILLRP